ncbi:MAG: UDP-N-acetylmuramoyl-L-alanine--D-glutamate ligase [Patescibacteria group bacterium]
MRKQRTELRGRTVAVLGAGVEGVSSAKWLLRQGAVVTMCDRRSRKTLAPVIKELDRLPRAVRPDGSKAPVAWRFGTTHADRLGGFDVVLRTQSRRYLGPHIQRALKDGVRVTSMTKLFFERNPARRTIGVTGTKGKGTTSSLIAKMLRAAGKRVWLGGNIGQSPLDFLHRIRPADIVVLELSSTQLQDLRCSPDVAVVTNVTADHLDYHRSVREYRSAKRPITRYQRRSDVAILNADDPGSRPFAKDPARVRWFSTRKPAGGSPKPDALLEDGWLVVRGKRLLRESELKVPGEHNRQNVLAAALAASEFGTAPSAAAKAAKAYRGLPYHLEFLGTKRGVRYFNDSYATSETAAIPAVASIDTPLVLIVGGRGKGLRSDALAAAVAKQDVRGIVAIPPEGTAIVRSIRRAYRRADKPLPKIVIVRRKERIVPAARELARRGDTVLLSPAATSFGWFENYTERGRFFTEQVKRIRP